MPPKKKKLILVSNQQFRNAIVKAKGKEIRHLISQQRHVEAIEKAKEFLIQNPNEPIMSCLLLSLMAGSAEWTADYIALRDRMRVHFRHLLDSENREQGIISGLFDDWTFLFSGIFNGEDILQLTQNHWIDPEEQEAELEAKSFLSLPYRPRAVKKKRTGIRIGYMSSSFHNTALCQLFCAIPMSHNEDTCTIIGFDTWTYDDSDRDPSEMDNFLTSMVKKGCGGGYHMIGNLTINGMQKMIQKQNLDVLVALDGLMEHNKLDILDASLARVTCTVLGYPTTTGCPNVNYFIGDSVVIDPFSREQKYSEHIAYMPLCCYVGSHAKVYPHLLYVHRATTTNGDAFVMSANYDIPTTFTSERGIQSCWDFLQSKSVTGKTRIFGHTVYDGNSPGYPSLPTQVTDRIVLTARFHYNLPENVAVFTTFNSVWKIDPELFQIWMKILDGVPNSVLWMKTSEPSNEVINNLKIAAGHNKDRLIFTTQVSPEEHVRRGSLATLHLDAILCNGHTTSIDAFYTASLVLTKKGQDFHNRVTCTLLRALCLPVLCTGSLDDYQEHAIYFGLNPKAVSILQKEVEYRKERTTFFSPNQFACDLEDLFRKMLACAELDPQNPLQWDDVTATANGDNLISGFKEIDMDALKLMVDAKTMPFFPPSPVVPVIINMPSPSSSSISQPMPSTSKAVATPVSTEKVQKIEVIYTVPSLLVISSNKLYLGQRSINVTWVQNAAVHVFQRMEENFDSLYIGPPMVAQFVTLMQHYLAQGIPKIPPKKAQYHSFFKNRNTFRHAGWQQFVWLSERMDSNGNMVDVKNRDPGLSTASRRIQKSKCFECSKYDSGAVLVATLLENHVPLTHTWDEVPNFDSCQHCGIPFDLFESPMLAKVHIDSHTPPPRAKEGYLAKVNQWDLTLQEQFVRFDVNLEGEDVLSRVVERYNTAASNPTENTQAHCKDLWYYQPGQKMVTFLWVKEAFERTVGWLKYNTHMAAASGGIGYQFIKLLQLNLMNPFCPRFQNLVNMTPDARFTTSRLLMRYDYRSSFEFMCQIFNSQGEVDEEGGRWRYRPAIPVDSTFCNICGVVKGGGARNINQAMIRDHLLNPQEPNCPWCGFKFGTHLGDLLATMRQSHNGVHLAIEQWGELIYDGQGPTEIPNQYDVRFH